MNNGKICVSICAETADKFIENVDRATKFADVVELRFDCLGENEYSSLYEKLRKIQKEFKGNFLATFRPQEQGGKRKLSLSERTEFWRNSNNYELLTDLKDFEFDLNLDLIDTSGPRQKIIRSFHDFSEIPSNLNQIYESLSPNSDVIKIAGQASDATDGLALIRLLEIAKTEGRKLIPIAMGEYGIWTRILGLSRGAFMTFGALDEESSTAPGQLTAEEMINVYRVKELDAKTEIYGLIAGSTNHSVSPHMHNAAFKFHELNAVYVPFAVKNLEEFMRRMVNPATREINWNLRGFSVTLPHKIEIIKYLDFIDETAQKIGAVNTVKIDENGKLLGFNTDAVGFIEPLKNSYGNLNSAKVAIFGAGGAARACIYALRQENANVTVFARNPEKAQSLLEDFGAEICELEMSDESRLMNYDIVVNATPLGMKKDGLEYKTPATAVQLESVKLVYDLIYNPFQTKLMQEAAKVFVPTIGGLAMLVAQAMQQQKIWTGRNAPMKEMSSAALRKLPN